MWLAELKTATYRVVMSVVGWSVHECSWDFTNRRRHRFESRHVRERAPTFFCTENPSAPPPNLRVRDVARNYETSARTTSKKNKGVAKQPSRCAKSRFWREAVCDDAFFAQGLGLIELRDANTLT